MFPLIDDLGLGDGQTIIVVHLGFNLLLLLLLPFHKFLETILNKFILDVKQTTDPVELWVDESCLDFAQTKTFVVGLSNIRRETMRMSQLVSAMAKPVLALYQEKTDQDIERILHMDQALNDGLDGVRKYAAGLSFDHVGTREVQELQELVNIAIDIKAAGDIISSQLLVTVQQTHEHRIKFSDEGWLELLTFNDKVMENMTLAFGALASRDQTLATMVVEAKSSIRKLERESRNRHFARLLGGAGSTFDSSDIHLNTLRSLKELNSKITEIVYPMLTHHGLLLDNRLAPN
jgi:phosphate:Na+ symporter